MEHEKKTKTYYEKQFSTGNRRVMKLNCPNCNTMTDDGVGLFETEPNGKKGKRFCYECWEWVQPVEAGKGKVFLETIRKYKKTGRF